jgi:hypothetical protein
MKQDRKGVKPLGLKHSRAISPPDLKSAALRQRFFKLMTDQELRTRK